MRDFRTVFVALVLVAPGFGFGSYELLCVTDYNNHVVRRFDGVTGASLGSFGGPGRMLNPTGIALDATTGLAYVANSTSKVIQVWNYSTGVLQRQFEVSSNVTQVTRLSSGDLMMATNSGLHVYSTDGAFVTTFASGLINGAVEAPDGSIWYGVSGGGTQIYRTNFGAGPASISLGAYLPFRQMAVVGDQVVLGAGTASNDAVYAVNWSTYSITSSGLTSPAYGVAKGHSGNYYLAQSNSIIAGNTAFLGTHSAPFGVVPGGFYFSMDSVVAPEPGTLLAVGLGLLVSVRRRKVAA